MEKKVSIQVFSVVMIVLFGWNQANSIFTSGNEETLVCYTDTIVVDKDSVNTPQPKSVLFGFLKERLRIYNPNLSDKEISFIEDCMNRFDLVDYRSRMVHQLCLESSASHTYPDGKVKVSSGNAIGMSQIVPTTAFHLLKHEITKEERQLFYELGVENFDWVDNEDFKYSWKYKINADGNKYKYYFVNSHNRKKVIKWLSVYENNVALWGYMMGKYKSNWGYPKCFIAYADGAGVLKGLDPKKLEEHHYIVGMKRKAHIIESELVKQNKGV